jgi:hypothetical protein
VGWLPVRRLPLRLRLETLRRLWRRLLLLVGTLRRLLTARVPNTADTIILAGSCSTRPVLLSAGAKRDSADGEVSTARIDKRRRAG